MSEAVLFQMNKMNFVVSYLYELSFVMYTNNPLVAIYDSQSESSNHILFLTW